MLQFLSLKRFVPVPVIATLANEPPETTDAVTDAPESMACGCGWFGSSFDLKLGLLVQELPSLERHCAGLAQIQ